MTQHSGKSVPLETPLAGTRFFAPAVEGPGTKHGFWRLEVGRSVRMRRWLVAVITLAGLLVAGVFGLSRWPVYSAQSQVFLPPPSAATGSGAVRRWPYDSTEYDGFLKRQAQSVSNLDLQINALHKLGPGAWQRGDENEQRAAERLGRALSVTRQGTGYQLTVSARASDAEMAVRLANAVGSTMVDNVQREERAALQTQAGTSLAGTAPNTAYLMMAEQPLHPDYLYLLSWTASVVLGGLLLGVMAAVLARKLDSRIYTTDDLLRETGQLPLAQLPDFEQVSQEVEEHYLLRLAAAIDHACLRGGLKNCLFTGVAPGVGVTTVAGRVRSMLETMGQHAVLVDSAESSTHDSSQTEEKRLVLSDAAPLLISNRTESKARSAKAIIVVVESGVTSKAQLARVMRVLERLRVPEVGFVLNRVRLEKADSAFRRLVRRMEDDAPILSYERKTERGRPAASHDEASRHEASSPAAPRSEEAISPSPSVLNAADLPVVEKPPAPVEESPVFAPLVVEAPEFLPAAADSREHGMTLTATLTPLRELSATPQPPVRPALPRQPQVAFVDDRRRSSPGVSHARVKQAGAEAFPRLQTLETPLGPAAAASSPTPQVVLESLPAEDYSASAAPPSWVSAYRLQTEVSAPLSPDRTSARSWEQVAASLLSRAESAGERIAESMGQGKGSRLSALRSQDFSMGMKNLRRRKDDLPDTPPMPFTVEYAPTLRQAVVESTVPELMAGEPEGLPARRVITAAQILPPKSPVESVGSPLKGSSTRRDRRRSVDNVDILPSRRGQYKKR